MSDQRAQLPVGTIAAVLLLSSLAGAGLLANFADVPVYRSWAVAPATLGLSLILAGFVEMGLGLAGLFVLVLLSALDVLPPLAVSWPFGLVWLAIAVVIGYGRSIAAGWRVAISDAA